jgi:DNA-directed RNA polymerase specialized sigma24 family protein
MRVTLCPPAEKTNRSPAFDRYAFENRRTRLNPETGLDFAGMERLHTLRIPDARKGRRLAVPAWALSDPKLAEVCVLYLEQRFQVKDCSGDLKARLQRCREAAALTAKGTKSRLERWIRNFRAIRNAQFHEADEKTYERLFFTTLRGETTKKLLAGVAKQVENLDSEVAMLERAPEIALSVLYLYFRMGFNSPSVAETLNVNPPAVRQIIHRASLRAVPKVNGTRARKHLKKEQIAELRRLHQSGTSTPQLASQFGIARDTARRIILRETKGSNV